MESFSSNEKSIALARKAIFPRILKRLEFMKNNFDVGVVSFCSNCYCGVESYMLFTKPHGARSTVEIACYFELLNFLVLTNPENGGLCIP